jgi:putative PIN family toxin of toxin-antitoxin system
VTCPLLGSRIHRHTPGAGNGGKSDTILWMLVRAVIDTNVFVGACLGGGAAWDVIRACLRREVQPMMGAALLAEYEDVLARDALMAGSRLSRAERNELLDIFLSCCEWTRVYFVWRPNLPDEADNHLIELAVAGAAHYLVTRNLRDTKRAGLNFPGLRCVNPVSFSKEINP